MRTLKRSLSLILAAILLASAMVVPVSAVDPVSVPTPTMYYCTDKEISVFIPGLGSNDEIEYQFCAILAAVAVTEDTLKATTTQWAGETSNNKSAANLTKDYAGAMIGADAEYKIYAKGYDTRTQTTYYNVASPLELRTLKSAPIAPLATEIRFKSATYNSITFDVQRSDCQYSKDSGRTWISVTSGDLTIKGLNHSTEYGIYFRVKNAADQQEATVASGTTLLVKGSTLTREAWPKPAAPVTSAASVKTDTRLSVVYREGFEYFLNGNPVADTSIDYFDVPNSQGVTDHREIIFTNLTPGTVYYVTCRQKATEDIYSSNDDINPVVVGHTASPVSDNSAAIRTKSIPAAPATPTTFSVDDKTIVMNYAAGIEYSYTPDVADSWIRATVNLDGSITKAVFKNLTPGTAYPIYARFYETNDNITGPNSAFITVTTKSAGAAAPAVPVLVDKTTTTIQVQSVEGVEFCIGRVVSGTISYSAWQNSGTFTGLTINTNYSVKARYKFNSTVQMAGAESSVTIMTPSRTGYAASVGKCTVTTTAAYVRLGDTFKVTATGDTYSTKAGTIFVYGDTRLIPVAYYTNQNSTRTVVNTTNALNCSFDVTPSASGKLVVTVVYSLQKFDGINWVGVKDIEAYGNFTIKAQRTIWTNITDALIKVLNVFTNTIPNFIISIINMFNKK